MSQQHNIATVKEIYDAVGSGDVDWAAEAAGNGAPWHGPRPGKGGVARFFSQLAASIEITQFTPHSFTSGENDVHLLVDWAFRSIASGRGSVNDDASLLAPAGRLGRVLPRQRRHRTDDPGLRRLTPGGPHGLHPMRVMPVATACISLAVAMTARPGGQRTPRETAGSV